MNKTTRSRKNSSTAWKAYARKEQESCDNSYRLSKAGQDVRGPPPANACVRVIPKFPRTVKPSALRSLVQWERELSCSAANLFHNTCDIVRCFFNFKIRNKRELFPWRWFLRKKEKEFEFLERKEALESSSSQLYRPTETNTPMFCVKKDPCLEYHSVSYFNTHTAPACFFVDPFKVPASVRHLRWELWGVNTQILPHLWIFIRVEYAIWN